MSLTPINISSSDFLRKFNDDPELDAISHCAQIYGDKIISHIYIDSSESILLSSFNLKSYQEKVLRDIFYSNQGFLQWNFYVIFLLSDEQYHLFKKKEIYQRITRDKSYARKYIIPTSEADQFIKDLTTAQSPKTHRIKELIEKWKIQLDDTGLADVYSNSPRSSVISKILSGAPQFATALSLEKETTDTTPFRPIKKVSYRNYRRLVDRNQELSQVNLLYGPNGAGKTSLLEAIELCLCGQTFSNGVESGSEIELTYDDNSIDRYDASNNLKYRIRDRDWYGRSYRNLNKTSEAFSYYNFLATDASYRLHSAQPENINEAFTKFIVGAHASALGERIIRLSEELDDEIKNFNQDISSAMTDSSSFKLEIESIRNSLPKLDSASNGLLIQKMNSIGFRQINSIDMIDARQLRQDCTPLYSLLSSICGEIEWLFPITKSNLRAEKIHLASAVVALEKLNLSISKENAKLREKKQELSAAQEQIRFLNIARQLLQLGGIEHLGEYAQKRAKLEHSSRSLKQGKALQGSLKSLGLSKETLNLVRKDLISERSTIEEKLRTTAQKIHQIEREIDEVTHLTTLIRNYGKSFLQIANSTETCPMCGHVHPEGYLRKVLERTPRRKSNSTKLSELLLTNANYQEAMIEISRFIEVATNLEIWILEGSPKWLPPPNYSVREVMNWLEARIQTLESDEMELSILNRFIDMLTQLGLDITTAIGIQTRIEKDLKFAFNKKALPNLDAESRKVQALIGELEASIKKSELRIQKDGRKAQDQTDQFNLTSESADTVQAKLRNRVSLIEDAAEKLETLSQFVNINDSTDLNELKRRFDSCLNDIDSILAFEIKSRENSTLLTERENSLEVTTKKIKEIQLKLHRASMARNAIAKLLTEDSIQNHVKEFLQSYKNSILDIFARIHKPAEFIDLLLDEEPYKEIRLKRNDGKTYSLKQISTGQRSALALSIFLALNQSAKDNINLIMIDDPIAHVDDLNSLAFIDYLRNAAIAGSQIIFATSDEKIAHLFSMKFEFMGEKFCRIELLGREAAEAI